MAGDCHAGMEPRRLPDCDLLHRQEREGVEYSRWHLPADLYAAYQGRLRSCLDA